jgi:hypothetical protein
VTKLLLVIAVMLAPASALAEKATYDLVRYTPPPAWKKVAWKKDVKDKNTISYTVTDKQTRTYCQIFLLRSTTSKGSVTADFDSDWKNIIVKSYAVKDPPTLTDTAAEDGWEVKAGVATFEFDQGTSIAMLTTITGYDRSVSIVAVTSSQDYIPAIQDLLGSVEMTKPKADAAATKPAADKPAAKAGAAKPTALQGYMDYNPFTKTWTWKLRYPPK